MLIPGKKIVQGLEKVLIQEFKHKKRKKKLTVCAFSVSNQSSSTKIKQRIARKLGIKFELYTLKQIPSFETFIHLIKKQSENKEVHGVLIEKPLPPQLQTDSIYDFVDVKKELEGHKKKTPYLPPLGLAVLTVLKYIYESSAINKNLLVKLEKDRLFFKKAFKTKKVVLLGGNSSEGIAIGIALTAAKINHFCLNVQNIAPEEFLKEADIVISAMGIKVITAENIKPGTTLISIGRHTDKGDIQEDYNEKEIKHIAGFYTSSSDFLRSLEVIYLYLNCLSSFK